MTQSTVWKTLDNNDLNQVVASSGFSENKGLDGRSVSRAHKTWSRSSLFQDFPTVWYFNGKQRNINFQAKIVEGANLSLNWLLVQAVLDVICYVLEILEFSLDFFEFPNDTWMRVSL